MRRRLALLAATAMLGTVGLLVPASPASGTALLDVCAGEGVAQLNDTLAYPVTLDGPQLARLALFVFVFTIGTCVQKASLSAYGHIHGWCGHSTGSGVTGNGAFFHFITAGDIMVVFGHLVGIAYVTPLLGTGSCLDGTAYSFLINGLVVLTPVLLMGLPPILWNQL